MNWLDYFLQIVVLGTFVWILKAIFFRPKSNKTQLLEANDDFTDKNKDDERIDTGSSSENSCSNFEKLKDSKPSEVIDTTDSYEDEECYKTCNNVSHKNDNPEKINETNVMECSGYGTTEEEIQNARLNMSDNSQQNLDTQNSVLKVISHDSTNNKHTSSLMHRASIETEIDLQKSNFESTEDEGNESQLESSHEELKKKTFFSDRKHKNVKRFTPIEIDCFENNENSQSLRKINTKGSDQNNSINNENDFSFGSSNSRSEEENYSDLKKYDGYTTLEIINKFTYSDESHEVSDSNCPRLFKYSRSLPSSIHSDDSSFHMQHTLFTDSNSSNRSQEVSDSNSSYSSSLPSSIHSYDCSFQNMQLEEDNDISYISSAASNDEMNYAFVEDDIRQE